MTVRLTCREVADWLEAYRSGALPADVRDRFAAHLADCPACRAYLADYERLVGALATRPEREAAPLPDVPEELVQRILRARRTH